MELLKEIARDKLVIMVTHNPELAEQYSTRIIRLLDGRIQDDTSPLEIVQTPSSEKEEKGRHVSMSFLTALSLSFNKRTNDFNGFCWEYRNYWNCNDFIALKWNAGVY